MTHTHKWFAEHGHIFSEETFSKKNDFRGQSERLKGHVAIAFNVGQETAEYIVGLHNEQVRLMAWINENRARVTDAKDLICRDAS